MEFEVFISYSSKDKTAADAACHTLESAGLRCWIAPRDVVPGVNWGVAILKAISAAKVMVVIFSGNANESHQIPREVERAVNKGIPIIPVRIENVMPAESLEYFLSSSHWLDAFTPPVEAQFQLLARSVRLLIGKEEPSVHTLPRPPLNQVAIHQAQPAAPAPSTHEVKSVAQNPPSAAPADAIGAPAYERLKKIFSEERPPLHDPFLSEVLWTLHRDPDPAASLAIGYEKPPHYDVEATFTKAADGITAKVRASDNGDGRPLSTSETRYSIVDGNWKGEVLQRWQR